MKFVDKVSINVQAGHGGPGASSFRREKFVAFGGPDGGDGGDGGAVLFVPTHRLQSLMDLRIAKLYKAKSGLGGQKKQQFGPKGDDTIIELPVGTMVFDDTFTLIVDLCDEGKSYVAAQGGKGGKGNARFKTSINRSPRYAQPGLPGESKTFQLELRLIAQVGLVGMPNAGKSTLLKALTHANPKIADYPFTTLYPNLGTLRYDNTELILADIPGLIAGSYKGQGLGHDFLRHIDRTKCLAHVVSAQTNVEHVIKEYEIILDELTKSDYALEEKPKIVVISKIDIIDASTLEDIKAVFKEKYHVSIFPLSSFGQVGLQELIKALYTLYFKTKKESS